MLSLSPSTYMLALAAVPFFLSGSNATPTGIHPRSSEDVIIAQGGPSLDDIAVAFTSCYEPTHPESPETSCNTSEDIHFLRSEENSIFAQGLIALCKLKPASINLWFDKDDPSEGMNGKDVIVKPYYMGDENKDDKPEKYEVLFKEWQQSVDPEAKGEKDADPAGGKMKFGHSDDSPWWPFAVLAGAKKSGWGKRDGKSLSGEELAQQTLSILSGFDASMSDWATFEKASLQDMNKANETPFILKLSEFNQFAPTDLNNRRWEEWVTVMAYDDSTKLINYAVSYSGKEGGITEEGVRLEDLKAYIQQVVYLTNHDRVGEHRAPEGEGVVGHAPTTDVAFGQPSAQP